MKKPFIKQKPFLAPSSVPNTPELPSIASDHLEIDFLNRLSVFETLRVYRGKFFHWPEHWQRLCWSCEGLGVSPPLDSKKLYAWIREVLSESGFEDAILRLSIHWKIGGGGCLVAMVREFHSHPLIWYQKGVSLKSAVIRRPSLRADNAQIKCSQYVGGVLATLDESGATKAHELLFLGGQGTVAEGSISNLFIIKEKRVLTPSVGSGILSGVTRAFVMSLCQKRGWQVTETFLTRHDFFTAEECFITNTSSEILPVVELDARKIGDGLPGPMTKLLAEDFKKNLSEEGHHDQD